MVASCCSWLCVDCYAKVCSTFIKNNNNFTCALSLSLVGSILTYPCHRMKMYTKYILYVYIDVRMQCKISGLPAEYKIRRTGIRVLSCARTCVVIFTIQNIYNTPHIDVPSICIVCIAYNRIQLICIHELIAFTRTPRRFYFTKWIYYTKSFGMLRHALFEFIFVYLFTHEPISWKCLCVFICMYGVCVHISQLL